MPSNTGQAVNPDQPEQPLRHPNAGNKPVKAGVPHTLPQTTRPAPQLTPSSNEAQSVNVELPFWVLNTVMIGTAIIVILWIAAFLRSESLASLQAERIEGLSERLTADLQNTHATLSKMGNQASGLAKSKFSSASIQSARDTPIALISQARQLLRSGKKNEEKAISHLSNLLLHPQTDHKLLAEGLLLAREKLDNPVLATAFANRLLKEKKTPPVAAALAMEMVATRLNAAQTAKYVQNFTKALDDTYSGDAERLIKAIANIHLQRGDYQPLQQVMRRIIKIKPRSPAAYRNLAIANHALSKSDPSLLNDQAHRPDLILDKAINLAPRDHTLWYDLARYHLLAGHDISAKKAIEKAIKLQPKNKTYHLISAEIHQRMGEQAKADWRLKVASQL